MGLLRNALWGMVLAAVSAVSAPAQTEITIPEIGSLKTDVKRVGNTLAVTNQYAPLRSNSRLCSGTCYYVGGTRTVTWSCSDNKNCQLECAGAAPRGSC